MGRFVCPRTDLNRNGRIGCYLQASFWRRDLLRSLTKCFAAERIDQVSDVYQRLSQHAGWMCEVAADSVVRCNRDRLPWDESSFARGMHLHAVARQFQSSTSALGSMLLSLLRPSQWVESLGSLAAPLATSRLDRAIDPSHVVGCDDEVPVLKMPTRQVASQARRAA